MSLGTFLSERAGLTYGHFALDALDKLAGKRLFISFYPGPDIFYGGPEAVERIPDVPIFFFPFGEMHDDLLGFHLLPRRVEWQHLTVAKAGLRGVQEIAANFPEYVHRALSYIEALHHEDLEDPAAHMHKAVALVNAAFGPDFYRPGRRGPFDTNAVEATVYQPQSSIMSAQISRTYEYVGRGEVERAARSFVRSMGCYHYTSMLATPSDRSELQAYFALGRELQTQAPELFTEKIRRELSLEDDADRVAWMIDLWAEGACKLSLKALCDLCYVRGSWQHPIIYDLLMAHFFKLKMPWAATLLEWRGAPEDKGKYDDLMTVLSEARAIMA